MTKKKLILLVGLHKTGTTSIQRACRENVKPLSEAGYRYPLPNINLHGQESLPENHSNIFSWMFFERRLFINKKLIPEADRTKLRAHFLSTYRARDMDLILCAELISALTQSELRAIDDFFQDGGYDISPICVIRKPLDWTVSMVSQRISGRRERVVTLEKAITEFLVKKAILRDRIENIRTVFPQTSFVPFDELASHRNGPAGWLFDRLGVSANVAQPRTNASLSDHSVRLASAITERAPTFAMDPHVYHFLIKKYHALTQIPGDKFHLRESEFAPLMPILIEENRWLKATFGDGFHSEETRFRDDPVALNDEQRRFMLENLASLPEPIIQSAVKHYMAAADAAGT